MNESMAREILGFEQGQKFSWSEVRYYVHPDEYDDSICIDGHYTADELEAIAWWMRNKGGTNEAN